MEEDYAELMAGEKDSEWHCQEHETTPRQRGQYGEINVAMWLERKRQTRIILTFICTSLTLWQLLKI
jgi:hypothetical protein